MPFALIFIGIVLLASGIKGTSGDLIKLAKGDLQGNNSYIYWMLAIVAIGSIGYIPAFAKLSHAFLVLVLIVLVLKEGNSNGKGGGFFTEFQNAIKTITQPKTLQ